VIASFDLMLQFLICEAMSEELEPSEANTA
jgi:hypothetical protein